MQFSELKASKLVAAGIASEAQFGQKTTLDLLDAEQDVNDAEFRLVTAAHNLRLAAYRLQAAIGDLTAEPLGLAMCLVSLTLCRCQPTHSAQLFPLLACFNKPCQVTGKDPLWLGAGRSNILLLKHAVWRTPIFIERHMRPCPYQLHQVK